jgi:uncharacterized Zn-finger protein
MIKKAGKSYVRSNTMNCGKCLKKFKSYLRLQAHMAEEHGQRNRAEKWLNYSQKESLSLAEERLKDEITKYNYYNTDRKN